jgi:alpha-amylase
MVGFKTTVANEPIKNWADNGQNQIAFCRGRSGFLAINHELSLNFKANLTVCVPPGIYCDILSGAKIDGKCTGEQIVVNEESKSEIFIPYAREIPAIAFHINSKLP